MRIQIISTYFAPEHTGNAPYVTQLAQHLAGSHEVTVVAGWPHYPAWSVEPEWRRWRSVERSPGLDVVRLAHYVPRSQDSVRRGAYEFVWAGRALAEGLRHPADLVIGVMPTMMTSHAAAAVAKRFGAPLGLVVQDLVGQAAMHSGIRGGRRAAVVTAGLESRGLARANRIATIHPRLARALIANYGLESSRIETIYNWSHIAAPTGDRMATRAELGWDPDEFIVLHSGNIGLKQALDNVNEAARLADARPEKIRFVIAGNGSQRQQLEAASTDISSLEVRAAVDTADFPDFLQAADALLVNERTGTQEMSVPSKLTSYFVAARPVLAATEADSATADIVRSSSGGVLCPPDDPQALLEAVVGLTRRTDLEALGAAGRRFATVNLSRAAAMGRFDAWVDDLVRS